MFCSFFHYREEVVRVQSLYSQLAMEVIIMTPALLMATPTASTPFLLAQRIKMAVKQIMMKSVLPRWC